uniref:Uncharacterized protein n=1 Tax=Cucumis melo TaxID=3656 RepID=A0A9I9EAW6_CUCME
FSIFVASNIRLASPLLQTFVRATISVLSSVSVSFKFAFHQPSFRNKFIPLFHPSLYHFWPIGLLLSLFCTISFIERKETQPLPVQRIHREKDRKGFLGPHFSYPQPDCMGRHFVANVPLIYYAQLSPPSQICSIKPPSSCTGTLGDSNKSRELKEMKMAKKIVVLVAFVFFIMNVDGRKVPDMCFTYGIGTPFGSIH